MPTAPDYNAPCLCANMREPYKQPHEPECNWRPMIAAAPPDVAQQRVDAAVERAREERDTRAPKEGDDPPVEQPAGNGKPAAPIAETAAQYLTPASSALAASEAKRRGWVEPAPMPAVPPDQARDAGAEPAHCDECQPVIEGKHRIGCSKLRDAEAAPAAPSSETLTAEQVVERIRRGDAHAVGGWAVGAPTALVTEYGRQRVASFAASDEKCAQQFAIRLGEKDAEIAKLKAQVKQLRAGEAKP
jgi:hypothetical protein